MPLCSGCARSLCGGDNYLRHTYVGGQLGHQGLLKRQRWMGAGPRWVGTIGGNVSMTIGESSGDVRCVQFTHEKLLSVLSNEPPQSFESASFNEDIK